MKTALEVKLEQLQDEMIDLGVMVERTITDAVEGLRKRDIEAGRRLIAADAEINRRRYSIESETLVLIARQQPMAKDLRTLAAILEIATELERIADYSKGIARISVQLGSRPLVKPLVDIPRMAAMASDMLHRALLSFVDRDAEMARSIALEVQQMDEFYDQIYRELITYIMSDPRHIEDGSRLTWVAHNLERSADRAVNICERVIFTVTGELIELDDVMQDPPEG